MTIEELAARVGVNATTLGRMEKGQTQKIGSDVLAALAREFNVSADFLLSLTDIPDRKNYGISELGLSAQAVQNLYTRKVNVDVVNQLLEQPRFATLTAMIAQYLDDTFAAAVAAQNQIFSSMSEMLLGVGQNDPEQRAAVKETVRAVSLSKVPPHQVELTKIQNTFMVLLKELKRDVGSDLEPAKAATREVVSKMLAELTKGQDAPLASVTPEQITDAIVHTVDGAGLDPEKLAEFRGGLTAIFRGQKIRRKNECLLHPPGRVVYKGNHCGRCGGTKDEGRGFYIPFVPPQIRRWDDCCRSIPRLIFWCRKVSAPNRAAPFPRQPGQKV